MTALTWNLESRRVLSQLYEMERSGRIARVCNIISVVEEISPNVTASIERWSDIYGKDLSMGLEDAPNADFAQELEMMRITEVTSLCVQLVGYCW
jgi:hypothetical protein